MSTENKTTSQSENKTKCQKCKAKCYKNTLKMGSFQVWLTSMIKAGVSMTSNVSA